MRQRESHESIQKSNGRESAVEFVSNRDSFFDESQDDDESVMHREGSFSGSS